jgi:hypothetical protein
MISSNTPLRQPNEILQVASRVDGGVGNRLRAADCVVGAKLLAICLSVSVEPNPGLHRHRV